MKKLLLALTFILAFSATAFSAAHKVDNITIIYESKTDLDIAIQAINWVDQFIIDKFQKDLDPIATIEFKDKVIVKFILPENNHIKKVVVHRVYGLCNRSTNLIQMTSFEEPWLRERNMFLLPLSKELHKSVVIHELAHLYLNELVPERKLITHASHEFFAYTVQLISLTEETRNKILALHPGEFDSQVQINIVYHNFAPHKYGVLCYKWYVKHGRKHLHMIVTREFIAHDEIMYFRMT